VEAEHLCLLLFHKRRCVQQTRGRKKKIPQKKLNLSIKKSLPSLKDDLQACKTEWALKRCSLRRANTTSCCDFEIFLYKQAKYSSAGHGCFGPKKSHIIAQNGMHSSS